MRNRTSINCGPCLDRLLVEGQEIMVPAKAFGPNGSEYARFAGLLPVDPAQSVDASVNPFRIIHYLAGADQRFGKPRIVISEHCFEPRPVRSRRRFQQLKQDVSCVLKHIHRLAIIRKCLKHICCTQHAKCLRPWRAELVGHSNHTIEPVHRPTARPDKDCTALYDQYSIKSGHWNPRSPFPRAISGHSS